MYKSVLLIGATGKTGIHVTRKLLEKGYSVTVLVRTPSKLGELEGKVTVLKGDALNKDDLMKAVSGVDAVVSVIGATKDSKRGMHPKATQNIVDAMENKGIRRLITMTGAGVRTEGDNPKFADIMVRSLMLVVARKPLLDGEEHAEVVKNSGLDWTIVRGPMLTDDPAKGSYKTGKVGDSHLSIKVTREDVASFIVDILEDQSTYSTMPMITN